MTVRIARTRWLNALTSGVGLALTGMAVTGLAFAPAATAQVSAPTLTGQACLVGTWLNDGGTTATSFQGHVVTMHGGKGDIDHIVRSGADDDVFGAKSRSLRGSYKHHTLYEVIRGTNKFTLTAVKNTNKVRWVEHGWTKHSKNTFTYRAHKFAGAFAQRGTFAFSYTCSAHKMVLRQGKRYVDTETRLSRPPS
jgi:hypothetical protein